MKPHELEQAKYEYDEDWNLTVEEIEARDKANALAYEGDANYKERGEETK